MTVGWGELTGLALTNVNVQARTIRVERQLQEIGGQMVFGPPKTRGRGPVPQRSNLRSSLFAEVLVERVVKHRRTPTYRPQTNEKGG